MKDSTKITFLNSTQNTMKISNRKNLKWNFQGKFCWQFLTEFLTGNFQGYKFELLIINFCFNVWLKIWKSEKIFCNLFSL